MMLKNILFDYRMQLTWKTVQKQFVSIIICTYWVFLIPSWSNGMNNAFLISFLVLGICTFMESRIFSNQVPKMFYLCPISREERRNYVVLGYWIRTITPVIVFIIIQCILMITKLTLLKDVIVGGVHLIIFSMAMNLYVGETEEQQRRTKKNNEVLAAVNLWHMWSVVSLCISSYFALDLRFTMEDMKDMPGFYVASAIVFLIAALPTLFFIKCYYPKIMNDVSSYESRKGMIENEYSHCN